MLQTGGSEEAKKALLKSNLVAADGADTVEEKEEKKYMAVCASPKQRSLCSAPRITCVSRSSCWREWCPLSSTDRCGAVLVSSRLV